MIRSHAIALLVLGGLVGLTSTALAQVTETYTFRDTLAPLEGGGNVLQPVSNGTGVILTTGAPGFVDGQFVDVTISASACPAQPQVRAWSFPAMTGLRHLNAAPPVVSASYSISMLLRFNPMDAGYARLIDFSNSTQDAGIYKLGNGVNFYPLGQFANGSFVQAQDVFVTITRDSANQTVSLYINGQPAGTQVDSGNLYTPLAAAMYFLMDNTTGAAAITEVDPGIISYLQLRGTPMSAGEVQANLVDICDAVACGDGTQDPGEECDDGGVVNGDGCSSTCTIEPYVVPPGVSRIQVDLQGAGGGGGGRDSQCGGAGGAGGRTTVTMSVTPGQTFQVSAGQGGGAGAGCAGNAAGGAGGVGDGPVSGGPGGNAGSAGCSGGGGGGGAASFFIDPGTGTFIVAGGGGGGVGGAQFSLGNSGQPGGGAGGGVMGPTGEPGQTLPAGGDGGGGGGGGGGFSGGIGGASNPDAGPSSNGGGGGSSRTQAAGIISASMVLGGGAAGGGVDTGCVPSDGTDGSAVVTIVPVITSPVAGSATADRTPAIAGVCQSGITVTVTEGVTTLCTSPCAGNAFSCDSSTLTDGDHTVVATQAGLASAPVTFRVGICGDGSIGPGEACDDSDTSGGDGCSATCTVEPGFSCSGAPSVCIPDIDRDGIHNSNDNCPFVVNPGQSDVDGDGLGDVCDDRDDRDLDGDGDFNTVDNCPFDPNPNQEDADGDGLGDACDNANGLDVDGDGDANTVDNCPFDANPGQEDRDGDGIGDACDNADGLDVDGDGDLNSDDNCPFDANPAQEDRDGDGIGDACDDLDDRDRDGDGDLNTDDNCPFVANPGQEDADGDGLGDVCDNRDDDDGDGDGLDDDQDNCPQIANPNQDDADGDDIGDACDTTILVNGGCSTAGAGGGLGLLLGLALLALGLRARSRRALDTSSIVLTALVAAVVVATPTSAEAQSCTPLDTSTFAGLKTGGCLVGGIATDTCGVSTPRSGDGPAAPAAFTASPKGLTVQIPAGATILKSYLVVYAKFTSGFNGNPADKVRLNGVLLSTATEVDRNNVAGTGYRAYDVTTGFGINGSGLNLVEERGDADLNFQTGGPGLGGEQLVVVFEDLANRQTRHVSYQPTFLQGSAAPQLFNVTGLPTCGGAPTNAAIAFSEMFECTDEQNGRLEFKPGGSPTFILLTTVLGGRDDGAPGLSSTCGAQDWNSLITGGSFGYDNAGALVGVAGDSPSAEPVGGTATNSRLSDELYQTGPLDLSGMLNIRFTGDGDQVLTSTTVAIDLFDADCDTIVDALDNCPVVNNPGQQNSDGDALGDACDNCPGVTNPGQADQDNDNIGDACDNDVDGDGVPNGNDNCVTTPNPAQTDIDQDGVGDACDAQVCGDGLLTSSEVCDDANRVATDGCNNACTVNPGWTCVGAGAGSCTTTCGDGIRAGAEACDDAPPAESGDGCSATCSLEPGWSCVGVSPDVCTPVCGDSVIIGTETCDDGNAAPDDGCSSTCNVEFGWTCTGLPSVCIPDFDGDGIPNATDNCPAEANSTQTDVDGDGLGDVCDNRDDRDLDGDGDFNPVDNCPFDPNPNQEDADGDGLGDACDTANGLDVDGDGDLNPADNCPFDANPNQEDADGDGLGDACDPTDGRDVDGDGDVNTDDNCPFVANPNQEDADGDGIGDACDTGDDGDLDGDGDPNGADNCPFDANAGQEDGDGDGIGDACDDRDDADTDGDGVVDSADNCPLLDNDQQDDADGDGIGDVCDSTVHVTGGCGDAGGGGARSFAFALAMGLLAAGLCVRPRRRTRS